MFLIYMHGFKPIIEASMSGDYVQIIVGFFVDILHVKMVIFFVHLG